MAANTFDRYKIESDAADKAGLQNALLDLASDIGELRRDVKALVWVMVPTSFTALVLAAAAFIVAVAR